MAVMWKVLSPASIYECERRRRSRIGVCRVIQVCSDSDKHVRSETDVCSDTGVCRVRQACVVRQVMWRDWCVLSEITILIETGLCEVE